jgi:hypothetical protein
MLRFWLMLVAIAACDAGKPEQAPPPPPLPAPSPSPPADAQFERDLITDPDAAHAVLTSVVLSGAPKWIGRRLMAGAVRGEQTHETFTLQRDGKDALVTVEMRHGVRARGDLLGEPTEWKQVWVKKFLGTAEEQGDVVTVAVVNGHESIDLRCERTKLAAARANAVRGRTPKLRGEECGDTGRWVPGTTTRMQVLLCVDNPPANEPDEWEKLAFAEAPGIEWLHVNDDCIIQGGGWRAVAADGAIAKLRE